MLRFQGAQNFRQRLVFATLSGRPVHIEAIRTDEEEVGLREHEAGFLRLLEKLVNGCEIRINETGTALRYRPGIITGGSGIVHECGTSRAIGYFVEPLIAIGPFAKVPLSITFRGITNDTRDIGVDVLRTVTLPMLRHFGIDGAALEIRKRGAPPLGGGEVLLQLPIVRELSPVELTDVGRVKRVRGVAYSTKLGPQTANRMVESARGPLNNYLPDVWIYTDLYRGKNSGLSPGFAMTMVAESTTGALLSAEVAASKSQLPEEVGAAAAAALLEQVRQGGMLDACQQSIALLLMSLGPEDVSRVRLGALTPFAIETLRLLRDFFGVTFQIDNESDDGSVLLAVRGCGFKNLAKRTT